MSRSFRHKPIIGYTTCVSEKIYKRQINRSFRKRTKNLLIDAIKNELLLPVSLNSIMDVWCMGKDGKHFRLDCDIKLLRK